MESERLQLIRTTPLKGIRKRIADRLSGSWREGVHVSLHKQVDVTPYFELQADLSYSLIDYALYGLVQTIKEERFGAFNSHFDGETLKQFSSVNLGLAIDHPRGLIVPNVFGAESMGLEEFASNRKEVAGRAKAWKHSPEELENGTCTVTNLGTMGIDYFTPILNPPQVAILGLGRTKFEQAVSRWGEPPKPKAWLQASVTIDHRVLDGADAARFMHRWEEMTAELIASRQ